MANYTKREERRAEIHVAAEAERSRPKEATEVQLCRACGAVATHALTDWQKQEFFCGKCLPDGISAL